ncbi:MAG: V-type ATPase subunit [Ruminococcus sp.]|nr:V-type ATPase subunit [Ruminococcus sp.]
MQQDYTYAVARIRFRENKLLSDADLSALLSAKDVDSVIRLLKDKGWGDNTSSDDPDELLRRESERMWAFINEIVPEKSNFDFFLVPNDFHNLKVSIKAITRDIKPDDMFIRNATVTPESIYEAISKREYNSLPEFLIEPAREAMTTLLQTSDGQLCDIIIDKACMEYVYKLGKASDEEIIRLYCELFVASADIKIAVRSAHTKKRLDFITRAMAPCETLDIERLATAASLGYEDVLKYLEDTRYSDAVPAIRVSMSAFEKWCDDRITNEMKPQKWEPFSIGPIVAYLIARENEIKAVRMILSAKLNGLSDEVIKERLRMMYV